MKKHLFFLLFIVSSALITPATSLLDSFIDSLDFDHARELSLQLEFPAKITAHMDDEYSAPIELSYKLRWGYKGAGNPNQPFTGINGRLNLQFNYDGLSFQLSKSRSLASTLRTFFKPIESLSPQQEFYLKCAQLVWTVSKEKKPDSMAVRTALETLVARLKITPGGSACTLYKFPILNTKDKAGLETYLTLSPDQCTAQFIVLSKKCGALIALITGNTNALDRAAYINALILQSNYFAATSTIIFPGGQILRMPFDESGSGDATTPFAPITISLFVPACPELPEATEFSIPLSADQVIMMKALMLALHNRRSPLAASTLTQEVSTLGARISITPPSTGTPSFLRSLLGIMCYYHQSIINYSFEEPLKKTLSNQELLLQLSRITYHAFMMPSPRPQDTADFVTLHTAQALHWYEGTRSLQETFKEKAQLHALSARGVTINWDLFIRTLIQPTTT